MGALSLRPINIRSPRQENLSQFCFCCARSKSKMSQKTEAMSFPRFTALPLELQRMIYSFAIDASATSTIQLNLDTSPALMGAPSQLPRLPGVFHACRTSRVEALHHPCTQRLYKDVTLLPRVLSKGRSSWSPSVWKSRPDGRASYVCVRPSEVTLELRMPEAKTDWYTHTEDLRTWTTTLESTFSRFEVGFAPRVQNILIVMECDLEEGDATLFIEGILEYCQGMFPKLEKVAVRFRSSRKTFLRICKKNPFWDDGPWVWDTINKGAQSSRI